MLLWSGSGLLIVLALLLAGCGGYETAPALTPASAAPKATLVPSAIADQTISRRTPFVPLDNPQVITEREAAYLSDDELVLGLEWHGEARAYPVQMMTYHHIVNDTVGGRPILITY